MFHREKILCLNTRDENEKTKHGGKILLCLNTWDENEKRKNALLSRSLERYFFWQENLNLSKSGVRMKKKNAFLNV